VGELMSEQAGNADGDPAQGCIRSSLGLTSTEGGKHRRKTMIRAYRGADLAIAEVGQPSGSLVMVREPSALTLIVPAPARCNCS
jgi:hypothetical protein